MNEDAPTRRTDPALDAVRDEFVVQWGAMGSAWGINRTIAQIHALLMVSPNPLSTDQVMEELKISRGNAHSNLRELIGWGLIRGVIRKGERKEYFEAEKDVWKMFCTIARERKRREIDPALDVLENCKEASKSLRSTEAKAFHSQISELSDFVKLAGGAMDQIARSEQSKAARWAQKLFT
jgi:DNA-binding transcriptional regulator GbsR (MarR family)